MSKAYWSGVFPAITTQLKKDQSVDLDATARHAEVLIKSGVSGLIFLGSLGENQALRPEEKRLVIEEMLKRFPEWNVKWDETEIVHTGSSIRGYAKLPVTIG